VTLSEYVSSLRNTIFDDLTHGRAPSQGEFSATLLAEARMLAVLPQMGSLRYAPQSVSFEFIYPNPKGASIVFSVNCATPERVVYLPVPGWVIQSIWQGEVHGSHHFESEANALVATFVDGLSPENNSAHFEEDASTGAGRS
jgi:hypothetical protein